MPQDVQSPSALPDASAPALRLLDRRAFVGFPSLTLAPGLVITDFALQVPDVSFPFNLSGGALKYQRKTLQFGFLELAIDAEVLTRSVELASSKLAELDELKLHFRPGYLEGQARFKTAERTPVTFKIAFDGDGEKLAVYIYDVRLYGFCATPASQVPVMLARGIEELALLPEVELRGATGFLTRLLPGLCQHAAVSRGFKLPKLDQARLSSAEVSSQGLRLRFSSGGVPPTTNPDEDLLLALEGARAFTDAEALLARGKLAEAREAYLKLGDVQEAHPFAAERLLCLLVADPQAHELALDVAAALLHRREKSAAALWAEAVVRERRGEPARAAERYLALCGHARKNHEEASAFFAAEAAARAGRDQAPQMAVRALHELLGLRPDHLPSLKALAKASDQSNDRAGAIRAYRRIAALTRDTAEAADAHVHMARLCAETEDDVAGARLHCEAALRLQPDHPDALYQLGELCYRAGEHLRALKALDRLRDVALARHEVDRIGKASVLAGKVWELGLKQLENALLRYREAVSLMPADPEPHFLAARTAEGLGKLQEATADYLQAVELSGPAPESELIRRAAHQSHHALSRLYRSRLGDPAKAKEHLEAALQLDPKDSAALEELIPYFRSSGRTAELAAACEKAALITDDPAPRAALWAEAGELYRGRLGNLEKAERLLSSALDSDPRNRVALEGLLALAEGRRDGGQLCRCLQVLAEITTDAKERARLYRRLSVAARDLAFDLELATTALTHVLELEPEDLAALGELCGLQRRRADMNGLAAALERRARVAEAHGDRRLASAAMRELAQVLELRLGRIGDALVAMEKAARLSTDPGVLLDLADLSLRCERPENAREALKSLLEQLPKGTSGERRSEIHARLGRACDLLGDREGAREHYAAAFPLRPLDDELALRLEALLRDAGHKEELAAVWAHRARALLQAGRAETAAPLLLRTAESHAERGEVDQALTFYRDALQAAPQAAEVGPALEAMAGLELARGSKLEASRLFTERAATLDEPRAAARMLFQAASLAGESKERALLDKALARDATFVPALVRRAELTTSEDPRSSLAALEAVLEISPTDPDAPSTDERLVLIRRAATVASRAADATSARRHLATYVSQRPSDVDAALELAELHRRARAKEPLCDLLGELWPRLSLERRQPLLREWTELCLELGRPSSAADGLRALRELDPKDTWAAGQLLALLPEALATDGEREERLQLLSALIDDADGSTRSTLLAARSELHRALGKLSLARADLSSAAQVADDPAPLWVRSAALAREADDELGELALWLHAVSHAPTLTAQAAPRLVAISKSRLAVRDAASARRGFSSVLKLHLSPVDHAEAAWGLADACLAANDRPAALEALDDASRVGARERRMAALLRRAELFEEDGDLAAAVESFERALTLSPGQTTAAEGIERLLRELEDWEGLAEVLATKALRAPRASQPALFEQLGDLYLDELDQSGPAEAAYRRALQVDRSSVGLRSKLALLLVDREEWTEAVRWAEQAAQLAPAQSVQLLRNLGERALAAGETERAVRLLRRASSQLPLDGSALEALARVLYADGAVTEALPLLERWSRQAHFEDDPDTAQEALLALADVSLAAGERVAAERALRELIQHRPSLPAIERLAAIVGEKNPREAIGLLFERAQHLPASSFAARTLVALATRAREELSDVPLAAKMLAKAAELSPEPLEVHRALADLQRQAGHITELLATLATIASLCEEANLEAAVAALEERTTLCEQSGRVDEALESLGRIRELWVAHHSGLLAARVERRRAQLLADSKLDLSAAEKALQSSFALSSELHTARLGLALAQRRDDPSAQAQWLERATTLTTGLDERLPLLLELAALAEGPLDDKDRAESTLREALKLSPSSAPAEAALSALLERDGRMRELAALYEESAEHERDSVRRVELLRKAARIYRDRANDPSSAAAALLAARATAPDDLDLTEAAADLLVEAGRADEASDFDALLLAADPFRERTLGRHVDFLEKTGDQQALAMLFLRRAEKQQGGEAATSYLAAAKAFRQAKAEERALLCESQAFASAPTDDRAFAALRSRAESDPRRLAEVLATRARALPEAEQVPLLRERAERLSSAGELILAAEAFDDLLAVEPDDVSALTWRAELASQAAGPTAAQPYDRRLLRVGGEELAAPVRLKSQMRLGHAALGQNAFRDAADAFEAAVQLDPEGERGREALSLLAEVHAKTGSAEGVFRTTLRLAQKVKADEADALLRRAALVFEEPKDAIDALLPLAKAHPADPAIIARAAEGLSALGRFGDLLELYERGAQAAGGPRASELLLQAARVAEEELLDSAKAFELKERAGQADPQNVALVRELVDGFRAHRDARALVAALERLIALGSAEEIAGAKLEIATLVRPENPARSRQLLEELISEGQRSPVYRAALDAMEPLARETNDEVVLARVLAAKAELASGKERAGLLLEAARTQRDAGDVSAALSLAEESLAAAASVEIAELIAALHGARGEVEDAAAALEKAAELGLRSEGGKRWLAAAEAWQRAGNIERSAQVYERISAEHVGALAPAELANRFFALGRWARAAELGFELAMASGDGLRALELADRAGDAAQGTQALWSLVSRPGADAAHAERLRTELDARSDRPGLSKLAALCESHHVELAQAIYRQLALSSAPGPERLAAFAKLEALGALDSFLAGAIAALDEWTDAAVVDFCLSRARERKGEARSDLLASAAEALPTRRKALLREKLVAERAENRHAAMAATLERLIDIEEDLPARSGLYLELGGACAESLNDPDRARDAFERALCDDLESVAALRELIALYQQAGEQTLFVTMVERLRQIAGDEGIVELRAPLFEAYEQLGRRVDAYRTLALLPESPERMRRRAELAAELGFVGDSLQLRERSTEDTGELEKVLFGYLGADLLPFAVKLCERLLARGPVTESTRRMAAERLSPTKEGCALAVRLWPDLLREAVGDADAWTLFAEALRGVGRETDAALVDGFGAALTGSTASAPSPRAKAIARAAEPFELPHPPDWLPLTALTMPRLHSSLAGALTALGAGDLELVLHLSGGVEAYLGSSRQLVMGAGALTCFGPVELGFLAALALSLGRPGHVLARPGPVPELPAAAAIAFLAFPSSLAACRVLAQLDGSVRGSDPRRVDVSAVLRQSDAFGAIARAALSLVAGSTQ